SETRMNDVDADAVWSKRDDGPYRLVRCTVHVGEEDIRRGIPATGTDCPVALAIRRLLRPDVQPFCYYQGGGGVQLHGGERPEDPYSGRAWTQTPPPVADQFMRAFDDGGHDRSMRLTLFQPFDFTMEIRDDLLAVRA